MIRPLACAALTLICCVTAAPAWAQSLGDVARKEAERRTTAKKAVKSFSNADLNPSEISNPSAPPGKPAECFTSVSEGKCVPAEQVVANSTPGSPASESTPSSAAAQKESEWRANAEGLRKAIETAQAEFKTLDDAANDSKKSPGERAGSARIAAQQRTMIDGLERKWQRLEKQAEEFRVPRTWLDPRPIFAPRIPR
jgi:hypothetical protein